MRLSRFEFCGLVDLVSCAFFDLTSLLVHLAERAIFRDGDERRFGMGVEETLGCGRAKLVVAEVGLLLRLGWHSPLAGFQSPSYASVT